jgi:hypothetical protein
MIGKVLGCDAVGLSGSPSPSGIGWLLMTDGNVGFVFSAESFDIA